MKWDHAWTSRLMLTSANPSSPARAYIAGAKAYSELTLCDRGSQFQEFICKNEFSIQLTGRDAPP